MRGVGKASKSGRKLKAMGAPLPGQAAEQARQVEAAKAKGVTSIEDTNVALSDNALKLLAAAAERRERRAAKRVNAKEVQNG